MIIKKRHWHDKIWLDTRGWVEPFHLTWSELMSFIFLGNALTRLSDIFLRNGERFMRGRSPKTFKRPKSYTCEGIGWLGNSGSSAIRIFNKVIASANTIPPRWKPRNCVPLWMHITFSRTSFWKIRNDLRLQPSYDLVFCGNFWLTKMIFVVAPLLFLLLLLQPIGRYCQPSALLLSWR